MRHQLSLEIPLVYNNRLLQVVDSSIYTSALPADCSRLEITVPGYVSSVAITVAKDFNRFLNACDLGLQTLGCDTQTQPLPDGIYVVRYSVSPNDQVFVEYNHLRMTQVWNRYYTQLSNLTLASCEPDEEVKEELREFQLVRSFLDAAKAKVEYSHEPHKGMELFVYAQRLLNRVGTCKAKSL
jgi:hypothetical protein